jgi:hypothetical protein
MRERHEQHERNEICETKEQLDFYKQETHELHRFGMEVIGQQKTQIYSIYD